MFSVTCVSPVQKTMWERSKGAEPYETKQIRIKLKDKTKNKKTTKAWTP